MSVAANHHAHQVLQVGPLKPSLAETLRTSYRAYVLPENPAERGRFLDEHGDEITVVATSGRTGVDAALMSALPNLGELLPHVASGTVETRAAMEELTLRNLDRFLQTGELVTPVPVPAATR